VVSFTPRPLYPPEREPGTDRIGGWVDPRTAMDDVEKRKFLKLPRLELRPIGRPASSYATTLSRLLGNKYKYILINGIIKLFVRPRDHCKYSGHQGEPSKHRPNGPESTPTSANVYRTIRRHVVVVRVTAVTS
jgi:hypothetical protein